ncbi:MAG TPA: nuclear transport factor 2 family protein [Deinococcales bacterium]|nr:nuclear transport factor 2 family protein [Deinococcales bacterium]
MSVEQTRATITAYAEALLANTNFADHFTDDVVLELVGGGPPIEGREAVAQTITFAHTVAFDSSIELKGITIADGSAAGEAVFRARHIAEFAGIPATGRQVEVPYSVIWDVRGDKISALRIYGLVAPLVQQLTAQETATA